MKPLFVFLATAILAFTFLHPVPAVAAIHHKAQTYHSPAFRDGKTENGTPPHTLQDEPGSAASLLSVLLIAAIILAVYLLPTFVASKRRHRNLIPIFLVNFFVGWTALGWFVALVWSFTADVEKPAER